MGAEAAVIASVVAAPLMLGSVPLWSVLVGLVIAALSLALLLLASIIEGRRLALHPLSLVLLGVVVFEALQILPLPPALLSLLSPKAAELFEVTLSPSGLWPAWRPLSLDPIATGVAVARHASWLMILVSAATLARSQRRARRLIYSLGASVVLVVSIAFVHKLLGAEQIFGLYPRRPQGWLFATFVNPNNLGAFLDLLAPVCLGLALSMKERSKAALWGTAFVLAGATCLLTLSRGGIVGLVVAVTAFALLASNRRRLLGSGSGSGYEGGSPRKDVLASLRAAVSLFGPALLIGGTVVVGAYLALDPILAEVSTLMDQERVADEVRWRIWEGMLPLLGDFWATGIGRGAFGVVYPVYKSIPSDVTFSHAENQLLQAAAELGVFVALALTVALALLFLRLAPRRDLPATHMGLLAGLLGLGVHEMTDFATSFGGVAVPASVVLGVLFAAERRDGAKSKGRRNETDSEPGRGRVGSSLRVNPLVVASLLVSMGALSVYGLLRAKGSSPDDLLEEVRSRLEADQPADESILRAITLRPTDHMVPLVVARESLVAGDAPAALKWINIALYLSPSERRAHFLAAEVLARAGRSEQARLQYRLAGQWGQPLGDILAHAALRYPSVEALTQVVPETREGRAALARFLMTRDRCEEARAFGLSALGEARAFDLSALGEARAFDLSALGEARAFDLSALGETSPLDLDLLLVTGRCSNRLGLHREAEELAVAAVSRARSDSRFYGLLVDSLLAQGRLEDALAVLREGLTLLPGDADLSMRLARLLVHRVRDGNEALLVLENMRLPRSDAARARMHELKGDAHRAHGRTRQAMEEYRTAARFVPKDPRPWILMGNQLMSADQWERAHEAYLEARQRGAGAELDASIDRAWERVEALRAFRARERLLGN